MHVHSRAAECRPYDIPNIREGMHHMKKLFMFLLIGALIFLAACAPRQEPEPEAEAMPIGPICGAADLSALPTEEVRYRIGISLLPISEESQVNLRQEIVEAATNAPDGFGFTIRNAQDADDQLRMLELFYSEGYDGVIVSPVDRELIAPILEQMFHSGILIVLAENPIDTMEDLEAWMDRTS